MPEHYHAACEIMEAVRKRTLEVREIVRANVESLRRYRDEASYRRDFNRKFAAWMEDLGERQPCYVALSYISEAPELEWVGTEFIQNTWAVRLRTLIIEGEGYEIVASAVCEAIRAYGICIYDLNCKINETCSPQPGAATIMVSKNSEELNVCRRIWSEDELDEMLAAYSKEESRLLRYVDQAQSFITLSQTPIVDDATFTVRHDGFALQLGKSQQLFKFMKILNEHRGQYVPNRDISKALTNHWNGQVKVWKSRLQDKLGEANMKVLASAIKMVDGSCGLILPDVTQMKPDVTAP